MIPSLRISLEQNLMPGTQVCGSVPEGVGVKHTQDDTYYERTERKSLYEFKICDIERST